MTGAAGAGYDEVDDTDEIDLAIGCTGPRADEEDWGSSRCRARDVGIAVVDCNSEAVVC